MKGKDRFKTGLLSWHLVWWEEEAMPMCPCGQLMEANTESQEPRQRQSVNSVSRPLTYCN